MPRDFLRSLRRLAAGLAAVLALALSLTAPTEAQQLSLQRYSKPEGLNNQNVLCLMQDREGYLWACSENGMYRYDGHRFRRYGESEGIDNTLVYSAIEDRSGRLWLATMSDLYVGEHGRFRVVRPGGEALPITGDGLVTPLADGRIGVVVRRRLWAVTPGEGDPSGWAMQPLFPDPPSEHAELLGDVRSVHQARDGRLWLGCGRSICEADLKNGPSVRVWREAEGVRGGPWLRFLFDREGRLWARGYEELLRLDPGAARFENSGMPDASLRAQPSDRALTEGPDGSIAVRSGHGIARFARGRWSLVTMANGLLSEDVSALHFDHEGSLWIGASGHGLQRWRGYDRIESWTRAQGLDSDVIWALQRIAPDRMLIGTRGACLMLDDGATRAERCGIEALPDGEMTSAALGADGSLWLRSPIDNELLRVAPGSRRAQPIAKLPRFNAMLIDSRQRLWIPTRNGIHLMAPGDKAPHLVGEDREFLAAAEDATGAVWFAGSDGLFRYADGQLTQAKLDGLKLGPGFASIAIGRDGTLWAGSRSRGVMRAELRGARLADPQWIADPMVADAAAMFVGIDRRDRVWVGTEFGIVGHDGRRWRRIGESDGLIWNDVDFESFHADADGSVWVGTTGGLSHIVDPEQALEQPAPTLKIAAAHYGDSAIETAAHTARPWNRSAALDLDLVSLSFGRSMDSVFRYRIVGVDADWFESRNPRVHYPALDPGRYRFEAMLIDPDRGQGSEVVGFDFTVTPPWWSTLGFRALVLVLALAALAWAWRWQLRRIDARHAQEQQHTRERTALLERASRDGLTGLWNRSAILDLLAQAIAARGPGEPLALAVLDVDHFKSVNDSHGHAVGDAVLRALSQRLTHRLRQDDLLGRCGGEEMLLVMPGLPCEAVPAPVERLREAVAETAFAIGELALPVTVSIGVAWFGVSGNADACEDAETDAAADSWDTPERLFERADAALYRAKRSGRNRVCCALPEPAVRGTVERRATVRD